MGLFITPTSPKATSVIDAQSSDFTFYGDGSCYVTASGMEYAEQWPAAVVAYPNSNPGTACTYTVSANGAIAVTASGKVHNGYLSYDGKIFVFGKTGQTATSGGTLSGTSIATGVKLP